MNLSKDELLEKANAEYKTGIKFVTLSGMGQATVKSEPYYDGFCIMVKSSNINGQNKDRIIFDGVEWAEIVK